MKREGNFVSRAMFERNLYQKLLNSQFNADMSALPRVGLRWEPREDAELVSQRLLALLPGDSWIGNSQT